MTARRGQVIGRLPFDDRPVRAAFVSWPAALHVYGSDLAVAAVSVRVAPCSRPMAGGRGDLISGEFANRPPSED